jgi:hypothetical protein
MHAVFQAASIALVQLQSLTEFVNVNYGAEPWRVGSCVMLLSMPVAAIFCTMGCWRHLLRGVCLWDPSS